MWEADTENQHCCKSCHLRKFRNRSVSVSAGTRRYSARYHRPMVRER
jgi:hypothetical protein